MRTLTIVANLPSYEPRLLIGTTSTNNVTFRINLGSNGKPINNYTTPDLIRPVSIARELIVLTSSDRDGGLAINSLTSDPLTAVGFTTNHQGPSDGFLALPCHSILEAANRVYEYFAVTFTPVMDQGNMHYSEILVVACSDNTQVTMTPTESVTVPSNLSDTSTTVDMIVLSPGQEYTFTLNEQETFLVINDNADLTGTRLVSNKPLTVTSGNDCTRIPANIQACEYLVEQIPPTAVWGQRFILVPFAGRTTGQQYKVVSSEDDTVVVRLCSLSQSTISTSLQTAGNYFTFDSDSSEYCSIISTRPVFVVQVSFGNEFNSEGKGDPMMVTVPPMDEYLQSMTFRSLPDVGIYKHYVSVMVPNEFFIPNEIIYDRLATPQCNWGPVRTESGILGWGCSFEITKNDVHSLRHTNPNGKLSVMVYGFKEGSNVFRAYGYLAGLAMDYHLR